MRWDCDIRLYNWICWHYWISATFERDENVKQDKTVKFVALLNVLDCWMRWECDIRLYNWICWHCWICGTVEWDMNEKLDNTT